MIGSLTGSVTIVNQQVLIQTQGVGYLVQVSSRLFSTLSRLDDDASTTIFIYTHVREDTFDLYGFETWSERALFILFLSVSGVGPSTAIHILNHDLQSISTAIQEANVAFFTAIPRIGKKVAQKIIIELGSKLGEVKSLEIGPQSVIFTELKDSLAALGFNPDAVSQVLVDLQKEHDFDTTKPGEIIKLAIAQLGKK